GILGHLLAPAAPALCHRDAPELLSLRDVVSHKRLDFAVAAFLAQFLLDCVDAPRLIGRRVDDPRLAVHADAVERSLFSCFRFIAPELERLTRRSLRRRRRAPRGWVPAPRAWPVADSLAGLLLGRVGLFAWVQLKRRSFDVTAPWCVESLQSLHFAARLASCLGEGERGAGL